MAMPPEYMRELVVAIAKLIVAPEPPAAWASSTETKPRIRLKLMRVGWEGHSLVESAMRSAWGVSAVLIIQ